MNLLTKIVKELPCLPDKDYFIALKLVKDRKFNDLALLINSVITLIEKNSNRENINQNYTGLDKDSIILLLDNVNQYTDQLSIEEFESQIPNNIYE